ncbi:MAG: TetR/AcrR family transcriptional regulator [Bacteroidales bacterium]|jgi:AcrR family transcriptional regulator|nr:TetR/AcrR family transcriptional regulator [Bacteroidales bacterium]
MLTDRQKEIILVSLELIDKKGIQGLTIKNLANKIGISEPAIYRHYENKIQILIGILDFFKSNTEDFFTKELKNDNNSVEKIERLFSNHFRTFSATPSLVSVVFSEEIFRNETILIEQIAEIMTKNNMVLSNIIETGQNKGEIRTDINPSYLSIMILGSLRMFVKQWQMSNYSFDLVKKGADFINSLKLLIQKN